jgi:hypothetical protein
VARKKFEEFVEKGSKDEAPTFGHAKQLERELCLGFLFSTPVQVHSQFLRECKVAGLSLFPKLKRATEHHRALRK